MQIPIFILRNIESTDMKVKCNFCRLKYLTKFDISSFRVVENMYVSDHYTTRGRGTEKDICRGFLTNKI